VRCVCEIRALYNILRSFTYILSQIPVIPVNRACLLLKLLFHPPPLIIVFLACELANFFVMFG